MKLLEWSTPISGCKELRFWRFRLLFARQYDFGYWFGIRLHPLNPQPTIDFMFWRWIVTFGFFHLPDCGCDSCMPF